MTISCASTGSSGKNGSKEENNNTSSKNVTVITQGDNKKEDVGNKYGDYYYNNEAFYKSIYDVTKIDLSKFKDEKIDKLSIEQIDLPIPQGYELNRYIHFIDNTSFIYGVSSPNLTDRKIFKYSINTGKSICLYEGEIIVMNDIYNSMFKILNNGNFVVNVSKENRCNILIFDKNTGSPLKEIICPKQQINYDISYDGDKIAYSDEKGIHVCDTDFSNNKLILNSSIVEKSYGNGFSAQVLFWTKDNKISYGLGWAEEQIGIGVISPDGKNNIFVNSGDVMNCFFFPDGKRVINNYGILNFSTKEFQLIPCYHKGIGNGVLDSMSFPCPDGEKFIFSCLGTDKSKLYIVDFKSKKIIYVGEDASFIDWSLDGKSFLFVNQSCAKNEISYINLNN